MADFPGEQTKENPYWFRRITGGDVSDLLYGVNEQEARVIVPDASITGDDIAVDDANTVFIRLSNNDVNMYEQQGDYNVTGKFALVGMTLNGESVTERWGGWGPGGFLYTWGSLRGPVQEPVRDTVWYVGVNRYGLGGFVGFWEDSFTEFRDEATQNNLGGASIQLGIGGAGQSYVWLIFRKLTLEVIGGTNPRTSWLSWFRKYTPGGSFLGELTHGILSESTSFGGDIGMGWVVLKEPGTNLIAIYQGENLFGIGRDNKYRIADQDFNVTGFSEPPINGDVPTGIVGIGVTTTIILDENSRYARVVGMGESMRAFSSLFIAPTPGSGLTTWAFNQGLLRYKYTRNAEFDGTLPLASTPQASDTRYYIIGGDGSPNIPDTKAYVADYAKSAATSHIKTINLTQFIAYTLTDWFRFPTEVWGDRVNVGTFPEQDVFDVVFIGPNVGGSIAVWSVILQAREALLILAPHFRNGVTGNQWDVPSGSGFSDPDNIYEQAMLGGIVAGREYGEPYTEILHGFDWYHRHMVDETSENLTLRSGGRVAMRAIDFGEIYEVIQLLAVSEPMIKQL